MAPRKGKGAQSKNGAAGEPPPESQERQTSGQNTQDSRSTTTAGRSESTARKRPASVRDEAAAGLLEVSDGSASDDGRSDDTTPVKKQKKTPDDDGSDGSGGDGDGESEDDGKVHLTLVPEEHDYRRGPPFHCPELYDQIERARRAGIGVGPNDGVVIRYEPLDRRGVTLSPEPVRRRQQQQVQQQVQPQQSTSGRTDDMQPAAAEAAEHIGLTEEQEAVATTDVLQGPPTERPKSFQDQSDVEAALAASGLPYGDLSEDPFYAPHVANEALKQYPGEPPNIGRQMVERQDEQLRQQISGRGAQTGGRTGKFIISRCCRPPFLFFRPVVVRRRISTNYPDIGIAQEPCPVRLMNTRDADIRRIGRRRLKSAFPPLSCYRRIRTWAGPPPTGGSILRKSMPVNLPSHPLLSRPGRRHRFKSTPSTGIVSLEATSMQDVPVQSIESPVKSEKRSDEAAPQKRGPGRPPGRKTTTVPAAKASSVTQPAASAPSRQPSVASTVATRRPQRVTTQKATAESSRASSVETRGSVRKTKKKTTTAKGSSSAQQMQTITEEDEEEEEEEADVPIKVEEDDEEAGVENVEKEQPQKGKKAAPTKSASKEPSTKKTGAAKSKAAAAPTGKAAASKTTTGGKATGKAGGKSGTKTTESSTKANTKKTAKKD